LEHDDVGGRALGDVEHRFIDLPDATEVSTSERVWIGAISGLNVSQSTHEELIVGEDT